MIGKVTRGKGASEWQGLACQDQSRCTAGHNHAPGNIVRTIEGCVLHSAGKGDDLAHGAKDRGNVLMKR